MPLLANISLPSAPGSGVMFAASIESFLIFLIIVGISSFFQWLKNKREGTQDWSNEQMPPTSPPPPGAPRPARKTVDWEEELRRMLEGETPTTPRPAPPVAPPVIPPTPRRAPAPPVYQAPSPAPMPRPSMTVPKIFNQPKIYKAHCDHCGGHLEFPSNMVGDSIVCPHCFKQTVLQPYGDTRVEQMRHKPALATFKESVSAFERAESMDERIASRSQVQGTKKRSAEIEQVVSLLHNPRTARQAVVASIILGTPKALEN